MKVNRSNPPAAAVTDPPVAEKPTRRTPRGELRRESLLKAASAVFLESGYGGASIEEVVRRVGGSKASLYSYFGNKEGLFGDIVAAQCNEFMANLELPTAPDRAIEQTLTRVAHCFLTMFLDSERRELFRIIVAEAQRFPSLAQRFYENGPLRARRLLGDYLRIQHDAGFLNCPDPEFAASIFIEMVKATPHHRSLLGLPPFHAGHDIDSHTRTVLQLFLHGCACPTPAHQ